MPIEHHPERQVLTENQPKRVPKFDFAAEATPPEPSQEVAVSEEQALTAESPKALTLATTTGGIGPTRILMGTVGTVTQTFELNGVATDPSPATATLEVLGADGSIIVPAGTGVTRIGTDR